MTCVQNYNMHSGDHNPHLKEVLPTPLLSHAAVLAYVQRVQRMHYLLEARSELGQQLCRDPTDAQWAAKVQLTEAALKHSIQAGERASQKLIKSYSRLVGAIAHSYQYLGIDRQDLIQEGMLGLNRAIHKFDPAKGFRLSTYARCAIERHIQRAVAVQRKQLGSANSNGWQNIAESLNSLVAGYEASEVLDFVPDRGPQPEEIVAQLQQSELMAKLMEELPDTQRKVLRLLYGLEDGVFRSLSQAADELGLSRGKIRWEHSQALKTMMRSKALRAFFPIS